MCIRDSFLPGHGGFLDRIDGILFGVPIELAILLTFIELAFLGFIIGTIVVRTGLPSFIVTLAFWFASRGLAVFLSQTFMNQSRLSVKSIIIFDVG